MEMYKGAMYQKDVMREFDKQTDVYFYGLGFANYDLNDSIDDIIEKMGCRPDFIIMGHAWLVDGLKFPVDPHPNLGLNKIKIPKIAILNKEYLKLNDKLKFIKENQFNLIFSHHHDVETYTQLTGVQCIFWPFAYDRGLFGNQQKFEKNIDFAFSGVLQNQNEYANQTDIRYRIQKKMFHCQGDIPVIKSRLYKPYKIFWNSIPRKSSELYLARLFRKYRYLSNDEYSQLHRRTKIYLNTLSPMNLVSPRYFENMASKTLVFCEESSIYDCIFKTDCYVTFRSDLSDFEEKLFYYLSEDTEREKIIEAAYSLVKNKHTWEKRVNSLIVEVNNL